MTNPGELAAPREEHRKRRDDPETVERALFRAILERGNQCLSQASLNTGFGLACLREAVDSLLRKGLIRPAPDQKNREASFLSYEANV